MHVLYYYTYVSFYVFVSLVHLHIWNRICVERIYKCASILSVELLRTRSALGLYYTIAVIIIRSRRRMHMASYAFEWKLWNEFFWFDVVVLLRYAWLTLSYEAFCSERLFVGHTMIKLCSHSRVSGVPRC